jgi:hypothetical protein
MKIVKYALVLTLAAAGCDKLGTQTSPPSSPSPAVAEATPSPGPHLAPPGVFYLVAAYRVETKSGVVGLPPGTGVKFLRDGIYLTPSGELAIPTRYLTNDMDVARAARDADLAAQAAARHAAPTIPPLAQGPAPRLVTGSLLAATPIPTPSPDLSVGAQRAELNKQRALIQQQIARVMSELHDLPVHSVRKSPNAERLHTELNGLHEQLRQINEQMIQLR